MKQGTFQLQKMFQRRYPMSDGDLSKFMNDAMDSNPDAELITPEESAKQWQRVLKGLAYLSKRFPRFWTLIEDEEIDLRRKMSSPFHLALYRLGFDISIADSCTLTDMEEMAFFVTNDRLFMTTSHFWNVLLYELRKMTPTRRV